MLQDSNKSSVIKELSNDYDIWGKLTEVYKLIGQARTMELSAIGLTPEKSHILRILTNQGGTSTIKILAALTLKRHNSVSLLVKRMEKSGLVNRIKDDSANQFLITITEKGSELFKNMPINSVQMVFSELTAEEKESLFNCLDKLDIRSRYILGMDYVPPLLR